MSLLHIGQYFGSFCVALNNFKYSSCWKYSCALFSSKDDFKDSSSSPSCIIRWQLAQSNVHFRNSSNKISNPFKVQSLIAKDFSFGWIWWNSNAAAVLL